MQGQHPTTPILTASVADVEQMALQEGFDLAGICRSEDLQDPHLRGWLEQGMQAEMAYLDRHLPVREHPESRFEWLRSALVLGLNYAPAPDSWDSSEYNWSCYARGDDYHDILGERCKRLMQVMLERFGERIRCWYYVDTGPISERRAAYMAGLGWIGKHGLLIHQQKGSYFFLATILTNLDITDSAVPASDHCGTCTRCIDACPTDAIVSDGVVDSGRCISYLNIEKRKTFSDEEAAMFGSHFFGCDICQAVCPWNDEAIPTREAAFAPREALSELSLQDLITISQEDYRERFRRSPIKRIKHAGVVRNAMFVAANQGRSDLRGSIEGRMQSENSDIRAAAEQALRLLDKK